MEAEGLEQKVSWLDEQRRRDLSILEGLEQRIGALESQIKSQQAHTENVAADISRLNTLAARIEEFDETIHKHRQEVTRQLRAQTEMREEREKNLEELRKSDQEAISKKITELREQVQSIDELENAIENRKQEELRMSREVDRFDKQLGDLETRIEDQHRSVSNLEDSRSSESQRLAETQSDVSGLRQQLESIKGNFDLVEDRIRRLETQVPELIDKEDEQRKTIEVWQENQSRKLVDFERQWGEWEDRFATFEKMANDLDERMIQYEETYRNTRQLQSKLEKVVDRLERRINEITEMQRLAEDRLKQELRSFMAEDTKRWNTYKLTSEEQWREHNRQHAKLKDLMETLEAGFEQTKLELRALDEGTNKRLRDMLNIARQWVQDEETPS